ncbi:MAG: type II CAAX endopeptidase family protein [Abditibacteriales bacterium]|nr:type II CAAX endopeptidase family protein [Abditibacteriales bacterium]
MWLHGWLLTKQKQQKAAATRPGQPVLDRADLMQVEITAKMMWGMESFPSPQQRQQSSQMRAQVRSLLKGLEDKRSASAIASRKLGILNAELGNKAEAARRFREAARLGVHPNAKQMPLDGWLWQAVYGEGSLTKEDLPRVRRVVRWLHLGWYEHLVLAAASRKVGDHASAADQHNALVRHCAPTFLALMLITFLLMGAVAIGLVLNIVALVLRSRGQLNFGALNKSPLPGRFLMETFALYFFLQNVPPYLFAERWQMVWLLIPLELLPLVSLLWLSSQLKPLGLNLGEIGLRGRGWWKEVGWGIAGYLTAFPWLAGALILFGLFLRNFDLPRPYHPIQETLERAPNAMTLTLLFLLAAVLAPVMEEIFFRGALHGALRRWWGPFVGAVLSAAFFALLHPQAAVLPIFGLPIFVLGALFSCMYELRGSLISNIVAHGINNGLVLAVYVMVTR